MNQQQANVRSTKPKPPPITTPSADDLADSKPHTDLNAPQPVKLANLFADCHSATGHIYTDPTGRFLVPSHSGNANMLVLYDYDSNLIHVEPMHNRTKA
jgi:hypothetical protein